MTTDSKSEVQKIFDLLEEGERTLELTNGSEVFLVFGTTGSGKSTFVQWIAGGNSNLTSKETKLDSGEYLIVDTNNKIGSSTVSKTLFPELMTDNVAGTIFYDFPGFSDTRGPKFDIAASFFTKSVLEHVKNVKILFVTNYFTVRKGEDRTGFRGLLRNINDLIKDTDKFINSIALVVTKVNNDYIKKGTVLRPDSTVIEGIANFLLETREDFEDALKHLDINDKNRRFNLNAIKIINILLTEQNKKYIRITLFRRPDDVGPLEKMELLSKGKKNVEQTIFNSICFSPCNCNDFGFTISNNSQLEISNLVNVINDQITENVNEIVELIREHLESYVEPVRLKIVDNNLQDLDLARALEFYIQAENDQPILTATVRYVSSLSKIEGMGQMLTKYLTELGIDAPAAIEKNMSKLTKYLEFFQLFQENAVLVFSLAWEKNFQSILSYFYESKQIIKDKTRSLSEHINSRIQVAVVSIVEKLRNIVDHKPLELEVNEVDEELKTWHSLFFTIVEHFGPETSLKETIDNITSCLSKLKITENSISLNLRSMREDEKYLGILSTLFGGGTEVIAMPELKVCINNLVEYLDVQIDFNAFIKYLYKALSHYKVQNDVCRYNVQNLYHWGEQGHPQGIHIDEVNFKVFTEKIKDLGVETTNKIKNIVPSESHISILNDVLKTTLKRQIVTESLSASDSTVVLEANFIKFSDFLDSKGNLKKLGWENISILNIFALNTIFIDQDLNALGKKLKLSVVAPKWEVIGNRRIELDGLDGEHLLKTENGLFPGGHGQNGMPGLAGGSAGAFFGVVAEFVSSENLTISAKGGKGGPGQSGGDGANGNDGKAPSRLEDNDHDATNPEKTVDNGQCAITSGVSNANVQGEITFREPSAESRDETTGEETRNIAISDEELYKRARIFFQLQIDSKYRMEGFIVEEKESSFWDYILPSRTQLKIFGHDATNGGDAGCGGVGGQGGFSGQITIISLLKHSKENKIATNGNRGDNGVPGAIGLGGRHGSNLLISWSNIYWVGGILGSAVGGVATIAGTVTAGPIGTTVGFAVGSGIISYFSSTNLKTSFEERGSAVNGNPSYGCNQIYPVNPLPASTIKDNGSILRNYLKLYIEHSNERFVRLSTFKFYDQINANPETIDFKDLFGLISDFKMLESISGRSKLNLVPFYERHLNNVENYISKKHVEISTEFKKVLCYLYSATLTKILHLKKNQDSDLIIDVSGHLDIVLKNVKTLVNLQDENRFVTVVETLKNNFKTELDQKIGEALSLVRNILTPELVKLANNFNIILSELVTEIKELQHGTDKKKASLIKRITKLKKKLLLNTLLKVVSVVGKISSFLGPMGSSAGFLIEYGTSVAKTFLQGKPLKLPSEKSKTVSNEIQEFVNSTLELHSMIEKEQKSIDDVTKNVKDLDKVLKEIKLFESSIYKRLIPLIENMGKDLIEATKDLASKSSVSLDIIGWKVQNTLKDTSIEIRQFTRGFKVDESVAQLIEKLEEVMATLIKVYDRIQDYQEQQRLVVYLADLTSASAGQIVISNPMLSNCIRDLKISIQSNIILNQYDIALNAFKQWIFPFAEVFLEELQLPEHLVPGNLDIEALTTTAATQIENIRSKIQKYKTKIEDFDKHILFAHFKESSNVMKPFYVWKNGDHRNMITKLLAGESVLVKADISQSDSDKDAIKFNFVQFSLKSEDPKVQEEVDMKFLNYVVRMTHLGVSHYRYGEKYFSISGSSQSMLYSVEKGTIQNKVYTKLLSGDIMLSPYAMWEVRFDLNQSRIVDASNSLKNLSDKVDLVLEGSGSFLNAGHTNFDVINYYKVDDSN